METDRKFAASSAVVDLASLQANAESHRPIVTALRSDTRADGR